MDARIVQVARKKNNLIKWSKQMKKDNLINEVDNLIQDSEKIKGAYLYHYCLKELKEKYDVEQYKKIKSNFQKFDSVDFSELYQKWFSKGLMVIKVILPDRRVEFEQLYMSSSNRKDVNVLNYTISDGIKGVYNKRTNVSVLSAYDLINTQINIIKSLKDVLENKLNEITNLLEFDVFEKELDSARYLLKNKYFRSAGAICGVILEKHLSNMLNVAGIKLSKKDPTLGDLTAELYNNNVIDSTQFKFLQFLGDIRNKCDHNKKTDPTKEEVNDLIEGTEKVIKTY